MMESNSPNSSSASNRGNFPGGGLTSLHQSPGERDAFQEASFFDRRAIAAKKITQSTLESFHPVVVELSDWYRVPQPRLEISQREIDGARFNPETYSLIFCPDLRNRDLPRVLHHEFNHIGQSKAIIAASLAKPDKSQITEYHECLVATVKKQGLQHHPLYVSVGEMFIQSRIRVKEAMRLSDSTGDIDEYLREMKIYRDSFEELTATIADLAEQSKNLRSEIESVRDCISLLDRRSKEGLFTRLGLVWQNFKAGRIERSLTRELPVIEQVLEQKIADLNERILHRHEIEFF